MKSDSPSLTAKVIAASTILLYYSGEHQLVPKKAVDLCNVFLSTTMVDRWLAWSAKNVATRYLWRLLERSTLPGIIRHYWNRKYLIEQECRLALKEGFMNVVVLGAGFDTLALRLQEEFEQVNWTEFDHPATQKTKTDALNTSGIETSRISFQTLDLETHSDKWPALPDHTVIIAEGLLMYFEKDKVKEIIRWANSGGSSKNRMIATYMEQVDHKAIGFRPRSWLIDWWLRNSEEPFLWHHDQAALQEFVEPLGYKLIRNIAGNKMVELIDLELPTSSLSGENLFVLESTQQA